MKKKMTDCEKILRALRQNETVTVNRLARTGRIEYDSVSKRIHDLRGMGIHIETLSRRGVNGAKYTTYALG